MLAASNFATLVDYLTPKGHKQFDHKQFDHKQCEYMETPFTLIPNELQTITQSAQDRICSVSLQEKSNMEFP